MIKCIIVDDEPLAVEILKDHVNKIDFLKLQATFTDALQALTYMLNHQIDVIFIDINMPGLSGLELIKSLEEKPLIVFTTAYSEYAVESYDYNATDYLLKPISYQRFVKSAGKIYRILEKKIASKIENESFSNNALQQQNIESKSNDIILVKSSQQIHKININDILFIEGAGNYWSIQLKTKKILTLSTYAELCESLNDEYFIRIHKSFVVNINNIKTIEKYQILIEDFRIPIGLTYRAHFFNEMNKLSKLK